LPAVARAVPHIIKGSADSASTITASKRPQPFSQTIGSFRATTAVGRSRRLEDEDERIEALERGDAVA